VLSLRNLLEDITAWGWERAPPQQLVFTADVPKLDQPLPRALAPDIDAAVGLRAPDYGRDYGYASSAVPHLGDRVGLRRQESAGADGAAGSHHR